MNITILGSGAYGLALSKMFLENNANITMYNKFNDNFPILQKQYPKLKFTDNLKESIQNSNLIVVAIPVAYLEEITLELKKCYNKQDIIVASKGISIKDGLLATEIIEKHLNVPNIGAISGGTFAIDMENKKIMGLTLATKSKKIKDVVQKFLANKYLKIQYTNDIIGIQICGAIKNVMAIGFGILDGAKFPESSRFLFLTEAIYEIKNLITLLGGNAKTIMSYAGIDDIMMTCTSSKSRNYTLGKLIGENNKELETYKKNTTIEGLKTAQAIHNKIKKQQCNMPLTEIIYNILYNNTSYQEIINYLENKESSSF